MSYGKPRGKASHEMAKNSYTQKSPQQSIPPPSGAEPGRTSYWSANTEDRSTFFADAPANSQHAARLMKIAMQNQPKYGKAEKIRQKRLEEKGGQQQQQQRRLAYQGEPVQQQQQQQRGDITMAPSRSLATMSQEDETTSEGYPPLSQYPYDDDEMVRIEHQTPLPEVYRYERDGKVTYRQIAAGGELKISAPLGSQEAQEMEYAATRLCKPQRYHHDSYVSSATAYLC